MSLCFGLFVVSCWMPSTVRYTFKGFGIEMCGKFSSSNILLSSINSFREHTVVRLCLKL